MGPFDEDFVLKMSAELGFTPAQTKRLRRNIRDWEQRLAPTFRALDEMKVITAEDLAVTCNVTSSR